MILKSPIGDLPQNQEVIWQWLYSAGDVAPGGNYYLEEGEKLYLVFHTSNIEDCVYDESCQFEGLLEIDLDVLVDCDPDAAPNESCLNYFQTGALGHPSTDKEWHWGFFAQLSDGLLALDETSFRFITPLYGCTDPEADNYNENATDDDDSCNYTIRGCTDPNALNYDQTATLNHACEYEESPLVDEDEQTSTLKGGISNRVFGADIPLEVKKKLSLRQMLNQDGSIFKSQQSVKTPFGYIRKEDYETNYAGQADLSSRTPFARLWTAIAGVIDEQLESAPTVLNDNQYEADDGFIHEYKSMGEPIIYMIGNHVLNTINVGDSVGEQVQGAPTHRDQIVDRVLPHEQHTNHNEFFKPPAGLKSVSSTTEGAMGALKKTKVSFDVHNFHDFDKIYSRYFMRHGAQIFVDFGWDTVVPNLYDPKTLIESNDIDNKLFGPEGHVTLSTGDLEVLVGYVTSYDAKIKEDGSVECELEIVSKNAALIDRDIGDDTKLKDKIKYGLDMEVIRFAASAWDGMHSLTEANWSVNVEEQAEWDKLFAKFAAANIGQTGKQGEHAKQNWKHHGNHYIRNYPSVKSERIGVMWAGEDVSNKSLYVSWGFFEDKILNTEFGFAQQEKEVQDDIAKNFESRYSSLNSFVRWDRFIWQSQLERENLYTNNASERLNFLYPYNWSDTYNTRRNKVPDDRKSEKIEKLMESYEKFDKVDKSLNRIPIREIFISLDLIKEAVDKSDSIVQMIKHITDAINKSSNDIFDIQVATNKYSASELSFIDRNYLGFNKVDDVNMMDKLFEFKPNSPNSIVQSYDLSFAAPKGGLQNMIAIQGMKAGGTIFPVTDVLDQALALESLEAQDMKMRYLPLVGTNRATAIQTNDSSAGTIEQNYHHSDSLFYGNPDAQKLGAVAGFDDGKYGIAEDIQTIKKGGKIDAKKVENVDKTYKEIEEDEGVEVCKDVSEYYMKLGKNDFYTKQKANIIPITLSLEIYGISTLVPGDLCKVDYLPERFKGIVYFQITKVEHDVDGSKWTTKLETVIRTDLDAKKKGGLYKEPKDMCIKASHLKDKHGSSDYGPYNWGSDVNGLKNFVKLVKPIRPNIDGIDLWHASYGKIYMYTFVAAKTGTWTWNQMRMIENYTIRPGGCPATASGDSWIRTIVNPYYTWHESGFGKINKVWLIETPDFKDNYRYWDATIGKYPVLNRSKIPGLYSFHSQYVQFYEGQQYYLLAKHDNLVVIPFDYAGDIQYYKWPMLDKPRRAYEEVTLNGLRQSTSKWNPECDVCGECGQGAFDNCESSECDSGFCTFSDVFWGGGSCTPRHDVCWISA